MEEHRFKSSLMEHMEDTIFKHYKDNTDKETKDIIDHLFDRNGGEAMILTFMEVMSSKGVSEYYNVKTEDFSLHMNEDGFFKLNIDDHIVEPSWFMYRSYNDFAEAPDGYPKYSDTDFKELDSDHQFSNKAQERCKEFLNILKEDPRFNAILSYQDPKTLLAESEDFVFKGNSYELSSYLKEHKKIHEQDKLSGLVYFDGNRSRDADILLIGKKTPLGISSYIMLEKFERPDLPNHYALTSAGTATELRGRGLLKEVAERLVKGEYEGIDFVSRTRPGASAPQNFTSSLGQILKKSKNMVFINSYISEYNFDQIKGFNDLSMKKKKDFFTEVNKKAEKYELRTPSSDKIKDLQDSMKKIQKTSNNLSP